MPLRTKKFKKIPQKGSIDTKIRKKLGMTQAQLASIFGVSRVYLSMVELGKRNLHSGDNTLLMNMFFQCYELETGKQATIRSLETRLFLNDQYKKILPGMQAKEMLYRHRIKGLKKELELMKEHARDAENAIIVFTTAIKKLEEDQKPTTKIERQVIGLNIFKQQAYDKLLTCWEPEQAKLHGRIEAMVGEAKALRRYRLKVTKEHNPFNK